MFRPLTLIGTFVVAIAVFSYLMVPGWRNSPLALGGLIVCVGIGIYAIIKDSLDFWNDLKRQKKNDNLPKPD